MLLTGIIIAAEYVLVPALTIPWEDHLAPGGEATTCSAGSIGVGLAEELTKALPVLASRSSC